MRSLTARIVGGVPLGRAIAVIAGGTAATQVIGFAFSPLLTRVYRPEEMAIFAVFGSFVGIPTIASCLRFETVIPLVPNARRARGLLDLSYLVLLLFSLAYLVMAWIAPSLFSVLGDLRWFLPPALLGAGALQALSFWANRTGQHSTLSLSRVGMSLGQAIGQIATGLALPGSAIGLVAGNVGAQAVSFAILQRTTAAGPRPRISIRRFRHSLGLMRREGPFVARSLPAAMIAATQAQLPVLIIVAFFDLRAAGCFALAQRVIAAPLRVGAYSIAQVFYAEAGKRPGAEVVELLHAIQRKLLLPAVIAAIAIAGASVWLFPILFGADWTEAGLYSAILAPTVVTQILFAPASQLLLLARRPDLELKFEAFRAVVVVGSLLAGVASGNVFVAVVVFAGATVVLPIVPYVLGKRALAGR